MEIIDIKHKKIGTKIAAIDLGTNTFKLIIGEFTSRDYTIILDSSKEISLKKDSFGTFTEEAKQNILNIMSSFKAILNAHDIDYISAKATSGLRNIQNLSKMIRDIQDQTGIKIKVISGEEEADLIHRGVSAAVQLGKHNALIIDIGGGSVEFVICNAHQKLWKKSFEIGSIRILDQFSYHDPITASELHTIKNYYKDHLQVLFKAIEQYQPVKLIGSSGAFRTLRQLHAAKHAIPYENIKLSYSLSKKDFFDLYQDIITKTEQEWFSLQNVSQIESKYLRLIVASSTLVFCIINQMKIDSIEISNFSLRMGMLLDIWESVKKNMVLMNKIIY